MHRFRLIITNACLVSCLFFQSAALRCEEVTLVADEWCPYNCQPYSRNRGFMIDIAEHIFNKHGVKVNYLILPWARAILEVRKGNYSAIVGAGRQEVPDFIFPDSAFGKAEHTFYVSEASALNWKFEGLNSLKKVKLGAIRGYSYGSLNRNYIARNRKNRKLVEIVSGETGLQQNIDKLLMGRIDVLIEDHSVFSYYLREHHIQNTFQIRGVADTEEVYIAFSPRITNAWKYSELISKGIKEMRTSGELDEIMQKYGLSDWERKNSASNPSISSHSMP